MSCSPARGGDARVRGYLELAGKFADQADMAFTLETIRKCAPEMAINNNDTGNFGSSNCPGAGGKDCSVALTEGYALSAGGDRLPLPDRKPEGGRDLGMLDGTRVYAYADGSREIAYSAESIAGSLLHELAHVRRACEGGGANRFTDERDAWDMQYRFYTRYQQKHGGLIALDKVKAQRLKDWQLNPEKFYADLVLNYKNLGYITEGRVTVEEQLRGLENYPPLDSRVKYEKALLKADKVLSEKALAAQSAWRKRQEEAAAGRCAGNLWECIPLLDLPL